MHEILVSEEEAHHCVARGKYYAIRPMLPELADDSRGEPNALKGEYSSADAVLDQQGTTELLKRHELLDVPEGFESAEEMLR
jgi:UDP-glucose 4-epimerase